MFCVSEDSSGPPIAALNKPSAASRVLRNLRQSMISSTASHISLNINLAFERTCPRSRINYHNLSGNQILWIHLQTLLDIVQLQVLDEQRYPYNNTLHIRARYIRLDAEPFE